MIQSHIREQAELEILYFDHETLHGEEMARCLYEIWNEQAKALVTFFRERENF